MPHVLHQACAAVHPRPAVLALLQQSAQWARAGAAGAPVSPHPSWAVSVWKMLIHVALSAAFAFAADQFLLSSTARQVLTVHL